LLFVRNGTLFSQEFDEDKLELVGEPVPVLTGVAAFDKCRANFSISNNGTLVFLTGTEESESKPFLVVTVNWGRGLD
jgi:hypothetical protein